jgi:hypothetical protein
MSKSKKGAMEISVGAIVVLILAITFLSLGLVFMKGMLGKMFMKFDEQISQEPEPAKPSLSYPITLSRNPVKTKQDEVEAIKISILNPSQKNWINRQFIRTEGLCGKVDGICYIDVSDTTGTCDTESNAKKNDADCIAGLFTGMDCGENGEKSPCLMSNVEGGMYCPNFNEQSRDPDCNAKEGIEVYLSCDERIMEKPFKRNIGSILTGEYKTNILLLRLKGRIPDDQYLCQIRIFAEDKEYMEDLVVGIENG